MKVCESEMLSKNKFGDRLNNESEALRNKSQVLRNEAQVPKYKLNRLDEDKHTPKTKIKDKDMDMNKTIPKTKTKTKIEIKTMAKATPKTIVKIEDKDKDKIEDKNKDKDKHKDKDKDKYDNKPLKIFHYVKLERSRQKRDWVKKQIVWVFWNNSIYLSYVKSGFIEIVNMHPHGLKSFVHVLVR